MKMTLKKISLGFIIGVSLLNPGICSVQQMIQTVLSKGQNALCLKNGILRKSNGDQCKDLAIARLALVACKGVEDFDNSQCEMKASRVLGYKNIATAKEDIIQALSQNSTYKSLFCGAARSKLTGTLKEIADKCEGGTNSGNRLLDKQQTVLQKKGLEDLENELQQQDSGVSGRKRSNAISTPTRN